MIFDGNPLQHGWRTATSQGSRDNLGPPVVPFCPFWFGGFPYYRHRKKLGYLYSNLSTGGPRNRTYPCGRNPEPRRDAQEDLGVLQRSRGAARNRSLKTGEAHNTRGGRERECSFGSNMGLSIFAHPSSPKKKEKTWFPLAPL